MRISILPWIALLLLRPAAAQFTQVQGTVIDPKGLPYSNGTILANLIISGSPRFAASGFPYVPPTQPSSLDNAGRFVMNLADVTQLLPTGATWSFHVCSAGGTVQPGSPISAGPVCFDTVGLIISGTVQDISSVLDAAAAPLTTLPNPATVTTTINGVTGALTTDAAGNKLEFSAITSSDPNGVSTWYGTHIATLNIGPPSNYDKLVDTSGTSTFQDQRFQLTGAFQVVNPSVPVNFFECTPRVTNTPCAVANNFFVGIGNTGCCGPVPSGFSDSLVMRQATGMHSPTSAATAGTAGEMVWDASNLYLATASGLVGSATWRSIPLNLTFQTNCRIFSNISLTTTQTPVCTFPSVPFTAANLTLHCSFAIQLVGAGVSPSIFLVQDEGLGTVTNLMAVQYENAPGSIQAVSIIALNTTNTNNITPSPTGGGNETYIYEYDGAIQLQASTTTMHIDVQANAGPTTTVLAGGECSLR
jgi:hypothetical protein